VCTKPGFEGGGGLCVPVLIVEGVIQTFPCWNWTAGCGSGLVTIFFLGQFFEFAKTSLQFTYLRYAIIISSLSHPYLFSTASVYKGPPAV
jgi:hypothetical protein